MNPIISDETIKALREKLEKSNLSVGEFEDTLGDVLVVVAKVENSTKEGGEGNLLRIAFAVLNQQENLIDVYQSAGAMVENAKRLPADGIAEAVKRAVARVEAETGGIGKVAQVIVDFFQNSSKNYVFVRSAIDTIEALYEQGQIELKRWNNFPS